MPTHSSILHDRSAQLLINFWYAAPASITE